MCKPCATPLHLWWGLRAYYETAMVCETLRPQVDSRLHASTLAHCAGCYCTPHGLLCAAVRHLLILVGNRPTKQLQVSSQGWGDGVTRIETHCDAFAGEPAGVWVEEPDSAAVGLIASEAALDALLLRLNRRAPLLGC